jgi:hypothetical protein
VNLSDFYSYRVIGKLTVFLQIQEFTSRKTTVAVPLPSRGFLCKDQKQCWEITHSHITITNFSSINLVSKKNKKVVKFS